MHDGAGAPASPRRGRPEGRWRRPALRAAALYAVFGAAWIFASDRIVDRVVGDPDLRSIVQTLKGWAFVAVSAALVYGFVARQVRAQEAAALAQAELRAELERHAEELERTVEERTAELRSLNEELETFATAASHDLRAPLRAIVGFGRALEEDHAQTLDERAREQVRRIVRAAERMDALIRDVLAYSRVSQAELTLAPVPLEQVVDEALDTLAAEVSRTGARVEVVRPLPPVLAHAASLGWALTGLLDNALKFSKPGTCFRVRITATVANGWVRISVGDEGVGIALEHLERIFRPFERLHGPEAYPGTGFGLAIVRRAVERMGGRWGVDSELGRGSTFWLELRAADAEASSAGVDGAA